MKKLSSTFGLLALVATFAAGCVDEDPNYNNGGTTDEQSIGYLTTDNLDLSIVEDTDQNSDRNTSSTRAENRTLVAGSEGATTDDYYVKILPVGSEDAFYAGSFKNLKAQMNADKISNGMGMALPVGAYTVQAWSQISGSQPEPLQSNPSYMGSTPADKPLTIVKGQEAEPVKVTCGLVNIKVTVEIEEYLRKNQAGESILDIEEAWVSLGGTQFTYKDAEGWEKNGITGEGDAMRFDGPTKPIYFKAVEAENTLQFHFKATPTTGGDAVTLNKNIPNVKAGHWRKIKIVGKHDTQGNLTFDIQVSTLVQDDTILAGDDPANAQNSAWAEETMTDPDDVGSAPVVEWQGGDVNADITVGASNPAANNVTISSVNKIASIALTATTTNSEYASDFESLNVPNLCTTPASTRMLNRYGIPYGSDLVGKDELTFSLNKIMDEIRPSNGRYTFTFVITDQKGFETTQALSFVVGDAPAYTQPLIEWSEGEFDKDVTLTSGMQINIKLMAQPSFKSIKVEIISDQLGAEMLSLVPLPTVFDLCDLQDFTYEGEVKTAAQQANALTNKDVLGLIDVVNDDLKQRSEADFVITPFVPIIMETFESGKFYFRLTVVDADNHSTTKTLQLVK